MLLNGVLQRSLLATSIASLILTTAVGAATVQPDGNILINSGKGYKPASSATEALPGDSVLVKSGKARIVYNSGCSVEIEVGKAYTVLPEGKCVVPANPAAGIAGIAPEIIIGGAAIAGGVVAVVSASGGSKSSSP